jgi:ribonuclease HI
MDNHINIFTDGGSRGNPGKAACAFVVFDQKENLLYSQSKYLGIATNNVAEYSGLLLALDWLLKNSSPEKQILIRMDSELLVRQLTGKYKVKDENLKKFYITAKDMLAKIKGTVFIHHIPRVLNKEADRLVNENLDSNPK